MGKTLINQTDSQGRKQGPWEETNERDYICKGHYVGGLREGLWKYYRGDGVTLRVEGHYLNDKRQGHWKYYHEDGVCIWWEGHYLNDKNHGLWKKYHQNGTLAEEGHYLDDMRHGLWKGYHQDGTPKECSLYNMGKKISSTLLLLPWLNLI